MPITDIEDYFSKEEIDNMTDEEYDRLEDELDDIEMDCVNDEADRIEYELRSRFDNYKRGLKNKAKNGN